jgi:formamidopyrimidine-DNA glycosylase
MNTQPDNLIENGRGLPMPELPEMETYRTLLTKLILNKRIDRVGVEREKSLNIDTDSFVRLVHGSRVIQINRRAKHLIFHLDNGRVLLLHLMLGGWMFYGTEENKPNRTAQVTLQFGREQLYFIGLRLGYLHVYTEQEVQSKLAELGPEPFDETMTVDRFKQIMKRKRGTLKAVLVDQKTIAGIGNCYSDEICFYSGLKPSRTIGSLADDEFVKLYDGLHICLKEACSYGGYMESPLYPGDQWTGNYNDQCKVYDNEGMPCLRCRALIIREEVSSKKSFHCPGCQY